MSYKKTVPRFGDPLFWNQEEEKKNGFTPLDADIYPEFGERVDSWMNTCSENEVEELISKYGTINAAIRENISIGNI